MRILRPLLLLPLLASCFPDMNSQEVQKEFVRMRRGIVVEEADRTVGRIELYKLRNGTYPASLSDLDTLLSSFAVSRSNGMFRYTRLDTGYQLDYLTDAFAKFNGQQDTLTIRMPPDYWEGLGCRRSNMMP